MSEEKATSRRVLITPDELIGQTIGGRYTLQSIIGGGGMGVVYETMQPNLGRPLALKLLKFGDGTDDRVLQRFKRELEIVSQLSHPNIVNVIEAGRDEATDLHFVVMERVEGVTLENVVSRFRMKPALALDIGAQICSALSEPHARDVVHRDVKPANIMFNVKSDGGVAAKLLDFGIARSSTVEGEARITTTHTVIGSPSYMAPEAASGDAVDSRTDLYSFGVVLYEMLAGDVPFRGSTPVAIMLRHAVEPPPSLSELENFPYDELSSLVDRLLEKEPEDRPESAREVLDEIERLQQVYDLRNVRCKPEPVVTEALSEYLVPRIAPPTTPSDQFEATDTFRSSGSDPVKNFDGWMVPQTALATITAEAEQIEIEIAPRRTPLIVVGSLFTLALLAVIFYVMSDKNTEPINLSDTVVTKVDKQANPPTAQPDESTTENLARSADSGTDDSSSEEIEETSETEKAEKAAKTERKKSTRVSKPPTKKEPELEKTDEPPDVERGFDWLKNK